MCLNVSKCSAACFNATMLPHSDDLNGFLENIFWKLPFLAIICHPEICVWLCQKLSDSQFTPGWPLGWIFQFLFGNKWRVWNNVDCENSANYIIWISKKHQFKWYKIHSPGNFLAACHQKGDGLILHPKLPYIPSVQVH